MEQKSGSEKKKNKGNNLNNNPSEKQKLGEVKISVVKEQLQLLLLYAFQECQ